jgi:glycine/D-amino acid oxidase-like deaminating enzyme
MGGGPRTGFDVAVVGAGIVGAACALACARRGLSVVVLERQSVASGTTGAGEGNLLLSDKLPGPELDLGLLSNRLWTELAERLPPRYGGFEWEPKGGLVVARTAAGLAALHRTARAQAAAGVEGHLAGPDRLSELEPLLSPELAGGVEYPQDRQVQPARAAAVLLRAARAEGAQVRTWTPVVGFRTGPGGALAAVLTAAGQVAAGAVVNAAGVWAGELAGLAAAPVPVSPRRGFVLVTEPVPPLVRHKVYAAEYLGDVAGDGAGLQASAVVEGTASGPVLIGATRELVGFDPRIEPEAVRRLALGAIELFPVLAGVRAIRVYRGYRPFSPDHLPLIGPDPRAPWLVHAHGHEGAGVGLAPGTGQLVAEILAGQPPSLDLRPFDPGRFDPGRVNHAD